MLNDQNLPPPHFRVQSQEIRRHFAPDSTIKDEFELYFGGQSTPTQKDQNLFVWWANAELLQLSQMTFNMISISAMSAEIERVFSVTKLTISPNRNRLSDDIAEATEYQNRWQSLAAARSE